jgi:hypothetical protein
VGHGFAAGIVVVRPHRIHVDPLAQSVFDAMFKIEGWERAKIKRHVDAVLSAAYKQKSP